MLVQKLRLQHGWSQQQLADASGLSVRTVQRIEAGYPASTESLKSLAAVFGVEFSMLDPERSISPVDTDSSEPAMQEALRYAVSVRRFYAHLAKYIVVTFALLAVNLIATPQRLWVLWVIAGWGLGIFLHAFRVFRGSRFLGSAWERKWVDSFLRRS
jgi:transcriptional regulator with XRE-family HTH domain